MSECRGVGSGPEFSWVEVKVEADDTGAQIHEKVIKAMADDGDVPLSGVHHYTTEAMEIGALKAAIRYVKVYREVRSL